MRVSKKYCGSASNQCARMVVHAFGAGLMLAAGQAHSASPADACKPGYVWREAFTGDLVCTLPEVREQARFDNLQASERRKRWGGASGPLTCRRGYVWREARVGDAVCVSPETRAQALADNAAAPLRRVGAMHYAGAWRDRTCRIYEKRDYGGAYFTLRHGDLVRMVDRPEVDASLNYPANRLLYEPNWNHVVSSVKVGAACTLTLWEHIDQRGRQFSAYGDYAYLGHRWNDRASEAECTCS